MTAPTQETVVWRGTPSPLVFLPTYLALALAALAATIGLATLRGAMAAPARIGDPDLRALIPWLIASVWSVCALAAVGVYLRTATTRYIVTTERLRITTGVLSTHTEDVELRRVRDLSVRRPFLLRLFGLGTVHLSTSDISAPRATLEAVPRPDELQTTIRSLVQGFYARRAVTDIEIG